MHGLFVNPASWENWVTFFEAKGYTCYFSAYPYHEGNPNDLRKTIDAKLVRLIFNDIVKH